MLIIVQIKVSCEEDKQEASKYAFARLCPSQLPTYRNTSLEKRSVRKRRILTLKLRGNVSQTIHDEDDSRAWCAQKNARHMSHS